MMTINQNFLDTTDKLFRYYKMLADKAMNGLQEDEIHQAPYENGNNIAILVKHISGNIRSRFTDFLTSDGEKPWRDREGEFEDTYSNRYEMLKDWEGAWDVLFNTLSQLSEEELSATVTIRKEPHSVMDAILRQLAHYAGHVGQIIYLAKGMQGENWKSLSIPKGQSVGWDKPFLK